MKAHLILISLLAGLTLPATGFSKETKDIEFHFSNSEPVVFSHDIHLKKYNNNCRVCHNAIFNIKQRRHFTMADMEKTKSCGGCHTGVKAFSVVDERDCTKCHKGKPRNIIYKVRGATNAEFSHEVHLRALAGRCKSCHNGKVLTGKDRGISMAQMEKGRTCGACHDGKRAFTVAGNCGNCHKGMKPREITFKMKGINDAIFSHDAHLSMYGCKDCHTSRYPYRAGTKKYSMAEMEKGKSCGSCHDGKNAFATSGDCAKCHRNFKPVEILFNTEMGKAKFSHKNHVEMFKCADCHTSRFPYEKGIKHYSMEQMEAGKSCGGCHNGKDAFSVKDDCVKCHDMK